MKTSLRPMLLNTGAGYDVLDTTAQSIGFVYRENGSHVWVAHPLPEGPETNHRTRKGAVAACVLVKLNAAASRA